MKQTIVLVTAILASLTAPAFASDFIQGQFPHRPEEATGIGVAIGTFENYEMHTVLNTLYVALTLRDTQTNGDRTFYLATNTTLNGSPLRCAYSGPVTAYSAVIAHLQLCSALPSSIVPGRTAMAVLFWRSPLFIPWNHR